jgi:hypothetical protein
MKHDDPITRAEQRLAALKQKEQRLQAEIKEAGARIREDAKPSNLLKSTVSGMFGSKTAVAETATAALGLGAGLVANNLLRKQRRISMIGKLTGLALTGLIAALANRRKKNP